MADREIVPVEVAGALGLIITLGDEGAGFSLNEVRAAGVTLKRWVLGEQGRRLQDHWNRIGWTTPEEWPAVSGTDPRLPSSVDRIGRGEQP